MITSTIGKGLLLFLMMVISLAINLEDNLITRMGLEMNYGLVMLAALVIAMLVARQSLTTIFMVGMLSFIVNLLGCRPIGYLVRVTGF